MKRLPYYKAYPRDFIEGTIGMPFEMKGAYRVVIDLIYMQSGRLPDDARYISGLLGCSIRKWKNIRNFLTKAGKIYIENNIISNFRADKELESLRKFQDKQRENRATPNKNNDLEKIWCDQPEPEPDIEKKIPNGIQEKPPQAKRKINARMSIKTVFGDSPDLPDKYLQYARKRGHPDPPLEWEMFVNFWQANGEAKADWFATWRNRVLNSRKSGWYTSGDNGGHRSGQSWSGPVSVTDITAEIIAERNRQIARVHDSPLQRPERLSVAKNLRAGF